MGREDAAIEPYKSLAELIDEAVEHWHESRVKTIEDAGDKDYRASQWMLERRFREQYADPKGDVNVQVNLAAFVQSSDWVDLRDRLLDALEPFPDAMSAVLAELGGLPAAEGYGQRQIAA